MKVGYSALLNLIEWYSVWLLLFLHFSSLCHFALCVNYPNLGTVLCTQALLLTSLFLQNKYWLACPSSGLFVNWKLPFLNTSLYLNSRYFISFLPLNTIYPLATKCRVSLYYFTKHIHTCNDSYLTLWLLYLFLNCELLEGRPQGHSLMPNTWGCPRSTC